MIYVFIIKYTIKNLQIDALALTWRFFFNSLTIYLKNRNRQTLVVETLHISPIAKD